MIIPLFIPHRGCPHQCLFCNQETISGASAAVTADDVLASLEKWLGYGQPGEKRRVAFFGGSFTCLPFDEQDKLLQLVQPFLADGRIDSIRISTRPDCLTEEVCRFLCHYQVKVVEVGVQSLDDAVLAKNRRGHTADQARAAITLLKRHGFAVGVQLMLGMFGQSRRSFLRDIEEMASIQPNMARLYPVLVVRGSGLVEHLRSDSYRPLSLAEAVVLAEAGQRRLSEAGIRVIRLGLQPCRALDDNYLAGPYHPAFGELVRGWRCFKEIRRQLVRLCPGEHLHIHISHRDYGMVAGIKANNLRRFAELGFANRYTILADRNRAKGSIDYVVGKSS